MNDSNFEAKNKISGSYLMLFFCHSSIHISLQGWIPSVLKKTQPSWARQDRMKEVHGDSLFCTEMQLGQSTGVLPFSMEEREFRHPEDRLLMRSQKERPCSNSSPWAGPPRANCHLQPLQHLPHFLPQPVIQLILSHVLWLLKKVWKQEATF